MESITEKVGSDDSEEVSTLMMYDRPYSASNVIA